MPGRSERTRCSHGITAQASGGGIPARRERLGAFRRWVGLCCGENLLSGCNGRDDRLVVRVGSERQRTFVIRFGTPVLITPCRRRLPPTHLITKNPRPIGASRFPVEDVGVGVARGSTSFSHRIWLRRATEGSTMLAVRVGLPNGLLKTTDMIHYREAG